MHALQRPRRIDELLNFRLHVLHDLGRAPIVRMLEGRYGVTRREWGLLGMLADHGRLSPSRLAELARLDRARTSRTIAILLIKGLALRRPLAGDARQARVELTAAGRRLHAEVFPEIARINAELAAALDDDWIAMFDEALTRLTARARELDRRWALDVKSMRQLGGSRRRIVARQAGSGPA